MLGTASGTFDLLTADLHRDRYESNLDHRCRISLVAVRLTWRSPIHAAHSVSFLQGDGRGVFKPVKSTLELGTARNKINPSVVATGDFTGNGERTWPSLRNPPTAS